MSVFSNLNDIFKHHPPMDEQTVKDHAKIRNAALFLANTIDQVCPECADQTLAINKCREAMMWANSAIALKGNR